VQYNLDDLADLGGVSRRTVRYYIQEGLLPAPHGLGRGPHYGPEHLDRLLHVKKLQEAGRSLQEIKDEIAGRPRSVRVAAVEIGRSAWHRLTIVPGVELHVEAGVRLPSPATLNELADWCRLHLRRE
jgi:DNA-binding transcriptional MerR regulator